MNPDAISKATAQAIVRHVAACLNSAVRAIEGGSLYFDSTSTKVGEDLFVEIQRIIFNLRKDTRPLQSPDQFEQAIEEVQARLSDMLHSDKWNDVFSNTHIRPPIFAAKTGKQYFHPSLLERSPLEMSQLVDILILSLRSVLEDEPFFDVPQDSLNSENIGRVRRTIPEQKIAPAQFDVEGGRLVVSQQEIRPKDDRGDITSQSLTALQAQGARLLQELRGSNCDPRMLGTVEELNRLLDTGGNIVQLGLANITCQAMCEAFKKELPDAICALIDGQTTGVGMYVGQFEEWQTFVENAAQANIDEGVGRSLNSAIDVIIGKIQDYSDIVDPEVPKVLLFLRDIMNDPKTTSKRAVFAVIRTIENLISKSFSFTIDTFEKTASKSSEYFSEVGSKILVRGILAIGLAAALNVLPVTQDVKGLEWISSAYKVVKEEISHKIL